VLGIFQEQLSKFIVGFRKEQVNANLLNGKGEIKDVSLNCSVLNELIAKLTPFIEFESVQISKLSFHVTSWANLKKAPLCVVVDNVRAVLVEPLHYIPKEQRRTLRQLSRQEYHQELNKSNKKPRGSYFFMDRIMDNLKIDIRSVKISFQPRGKFKTRQNGPWTPPCLHIFLRHVLYQSVNELGNPASPDDCWKHNTFQGRPQQQTLSIYKKVSMGMEVAFTSVDCMKDETSISNEILLVPEANVEIQLMFHKRVRDAAILSIQMDATVNKIEFCIEAEDVGMLVHAISGFRYCFTKDRAFEDPLVGTRSKFPVSGGSGATVEIVLGKSGSGVESRTHSPLVMEEGLVGDGENDEESDEDCRTTEREDVAFGEFGLGSMEVMKTEDEENTGGLKINADESTVKLSAEESATSTSSPTYSEKAPKRKNCDRPVIVLPTGIVIHEKISFSFSINHCTVRGIYERNIAPDNSYAQIDVKGLIAEMMWPGTTGEKGVCFQMSLSYMSLQEKYGQKISFLILGGKHLDFQGRPVECPSPAFTEIPCDEHFPLFEDRCIRPDPLRLRNTFPSQTVGLKSTVDFVENIACLGQEEIMVFNEIGLDQFEITLAIDSWCRLLRFSMNEGGGGFDPRWNSGDWSDELMTEMLMHPSQPLNFANHVQETPEITLDENEFISSDHFNVTARILNLQVRLPAAINKDVRSCDLTMAVGEFMLVISSALPRICLTGKIGSSINGDNPAGSTLIDFPNDPSDICYKLEKAEDPLIRQNAFRRIVSTFRSQITIRDFSMKLVPIIPFCNHAKPQELIEPLEFNFLACFEGESPDTGESNPMKLVFLSSIQINRIGINVDFDLLSGALSTVMYHANTVKTTLAYISKIHGGMEFEASKANLDCAANATSSRYVLTKRQYKKSRETGGLTFSFCIQLSELSVSIWRQNVVMKSKFRASVNEGDNLPIEESVIPLIQLLKLQLRTLDLGFERFIANDESRTILKGSLTVINIDICDFDKECDLYPIYCREKGERDNEGEADFFLDDKVEISERGKQRTPEPDFHPSMVELVAMGNHVLPDASKSDDIKVRFEKRTGTFLEIALSLDICSGGAINLHVHEVESFVLLLVEALLLPTGLLPVVRKKDSNGQIKAMEFPSGSIGALFSSVASSCFFFEKPGGPDNEGVKEPREAKNVEELMETLILSQLPENTSTFLARVRVTNLIVFVPQKRPKDIVSSALGFGLFVREASVLTSYLADLHSIEDSTILAVLGQCGSQWSELFVDMIPGFQHSIISVQSLHAAEPTKSRGKLTDTLIPMFTLRGMYIPSKLDLSLADSILSVTDLDNLATFYGAVLLFVDRTKIAKQRIANVIAAMKTIESTNGKRDETKEKFDPIDTVSSLDATRTYLRSLSNLVATHDLQTKSAMRHQQLRIKDLEFQVFSKERARLAALGLVASQAAGWLRMGGIHTHGQRAPKVVNMWQYYAVLRKSLFIVYSDPGKPTPLDIVCLQGASLHVLTGGRRMSDARHGFAIVEKTRKARLFIALNTKEYEFWVKELNFAITLYSQHNDYRVKNASPFENSPEWEDGASSMFHESHNENMNVQMRFRTSSSDTDFPVATSTPRRGDKVRASLSNLTAAAKSKLAGSRMSRNRTTLVVNSGKDELNESVEDTCHDNFCHEGVVASDSEFQAKQGDTKATTQQSLSCNAERELQTSTSSLLIDKGVPSFTSNDDEDSSNLGRGQQMGKRFASLRSTAKIRVGGVVQAAKEKTKAVAEQRRKLRIGVQKHDGHPEEGGLGGDFKSKIDGVAYSLKQQTEIVEVHHESHVNSILVQPSKSWETAIDDQSICPEDLNPKRPEILQEVRKLVNLDYHQATVTCSATLNNVTNDVHEMGLPQVDMAVLKGDEDEHWIESGASRPRFGTRVKKLGVSMSGERAKSQKRDQLKQEEVGGERFSVRSRFSKSMMSSDASYVDLEGTKLRGVRIGDRPAGNFGESLIPIPDSILEKMSGDWIVHVAPHIFLPGEIVPNAPQKSQRNQEVVIESSLEGGFDQSDGAKPSKYDDVCAKLTTAQDGYKITLIPQFSGESKPFQNQTSILCTFDDVLALYMSISEAVASVIPQMMCTSFDEVRDAGSQMRQDLASTLGLSTLDCVKLTGTLLGGLIDASMHIEHTPAFLEYKCEVLTEFLSSTLRCPLPDEARRAMADFFKIDCNHGTVSSPSKFEPLADDKLNGVLDKRLVPNQKSSTGEDILAMITAIQTGLLRAESKRAFSPNTASYTLPQRKLSQQLSHHSSSFLHLEPLLPSAITNILRDSLHDALVTVMAERDEARAQMIAANVMHTHEVEQERKKVAVLDEKLKIAQALAENLLNQELGFLNPFQNNSSGRDQARKESEEKLKILADGVVQNTDAELVALCQQLSAEITSKTSKSLEIIRMKEFRKIEQEGDMAEKLALQAELQRVKEDLAVHKAKYDIAQREAQEWKEAYDELKEGKSSEFRI